MNEQRISFIKKRNAYPKKNAYLIFDDSGVLKRGHATLDLMLCCLQLNSVTTTRKTIYLHAKRFDLMNIKSPLDINDFNIINNYMIMGNLANGKTSDIGSSGDISGF